MKERRKETNYETHCICPYRCPAVVVLSLPVLADGTETSGEPVEVANIDFAKKYQDLNLTQPTDANGLENLGIGVADKTSVK